MSHTPGPWSSDWDDNGFFYIQPFGAVLRGCPGDDAEDNARLMASALELLEALKSAVDHIHDLRIILEQAAEMGLTLHMCGVTYDDAKARAAIAKATKAEVEA